MFERSLPLFRPFGIQIQVHWTWLLLALLVSSSLARGFFPYIVPGFSQALYWVIGVAGALGLFLSIVIHELCHAVVGRSYKLPMEKITLFLFGGVAHMEDEPPSPRAEFEMAIAGPLASLVLAIGFFGLYRILAVAEKSVLLQALLSYLASVNVVVAVFNMLPGYPLDGGRVLRSALWKLKGDIVWATKISSFIGQAFGALLMIMGVLGFFSGNGVSSIWSFFLGALLMMFARGSYTQILVKQALHGKPAAEFMNASPMIVQPDTRVSQLVRDSIQKEDQFVYPVVGDEGEFVGCVDVREAKRIPETEWNIHYVSEITKTCTPEMQIAPETDAEDALTTMSRTGRRELIVVQGRKLLGILTQTSLMRYLRLREA